MAFRGRTHRRGARYGARRRCPPERLTPGTEPSVALHLDADAEPGVLYDPATSTIARTNNARRPCRRLSNRRRAHIQRMWALLRGSYSECPRRPTTSPTSGMQYNPSPATYLCRNLRDRSGNENPRTASAQK